MSIKTIVNYARSGNLQKVREELLAGADVNLGEGEGTALSFACTIGDFGIAKLLIENGANVNALDIDRCTPISWAGNGGHIDIVKLLLEHGAEVNAGSKHGLTPLIHAAVRGETEIVALYLENGAKSKHSSGTTALIHACSFGFLDTAKLLLPYSDINHQNKDGLTALMMASENNHIELTELLLQNGADTNLSDKAFSATALMKSAVNGNFEVVKLLVSYGADIMAKDKNGRTVLDMCKRHQKLHRYLNEFKEK